MCGKIKKLNQEDMWYVDDDDYSEDEFRLESTRCYIKELWDKQNEIINAINELFEKRN